MARRTFSDNTPEERREFGRQGGIKSGETKRKKRAMKERLEILLNMPLNNKREYDIEEIRSFAALKGKNVTVEDAMMIAQIHKALRGDTVAATFVRDTAGQRPDSNMNIDMNLPVMFEGENELAD